MWDVGWSELSLNGSDPQGGKGGASDAAAPPHTDWELIPDLLTEPD